MFWVARGRKNRQKISTHRSADNGHLDFALGGAHQLLKLLADALQETQSVVVGQSLEEVLDGLVLLGSDVLLEDGDDGLLVLLGQSGCQKDLCKLGVLVVYIVEGGQCLGGGVEGGGLDCSSVLWEQSDVSQKRSYHRVQSQLS